MWLHRDHRQMVTLTSGDDSMSIIVRGGKIALSTLKPAIMQAVQPHWNRYGRGHDGIWAQGPSRQCAIRWWSGVNPCSTPQSTA
jgi:hypothetical protein